MEENLVCAFVLLAFFAGFVFGMSIISFFHDARSLCEYVADLKSSAPAEENKKC